jgi:AcrR family transcriptional regulator
MSEAGRSQASDRHGEPELGPLLGGVHGLSRDQVRESQRERLLAALVELVAERGFGAANVADIAKRAAVSSRDFYAIFDSKEACFLAALEAILDHLRAVADDSVDPDAPWPGQLVAALTAIADFLDAEPEVARFCLIGTLSATPAISARLREAVLATAPFLREGRTASKAAAGLADSTEDSLLGGVVFSASRAATGGENLRTHLPEFVEFLLTPYLGLGEARRYAGKSG